MTVLENDAAVAKYGQDVMQYKKQKYTSAIDPARPSPETEIFKKRCKRLNLTYCGGALLNILYFPDCDAFNSTHHVCYFNSIAISNVWGLGSQLNFVEKN